MSTWVNVYASAGDLPTVDPTFPPSFNLGEDVQVMVTADDPVEWFEQASALFLQAAKNLREAQEQSARDLAESRAEVDALRASAEDHSQSKRFTLDRWVRERERVPAEGNTVTADELILALDKAEGPQVDHMNWPYIAADIEIIDGGLRPVVEWLLANFEITPRPATEGRPS